LTAAAKASGGGGAPSVVCAAKVSLVASLVCQMFLLANTASP
jgi:hypothetical protein